MKILIVDDEKLARLRLRSALASSGFNDIEEAIDGFDALERLAHFSPELVFLDIEMPELNGFDLLRNIPRRDFEVIFQTAYDSFAIQAFEVNACDYLLKPFSDERLAQALDRARQRLAVRKESAEFQQLDDYLAANERFLTRFAVNVGSRTKVIDQDEVVYFLSEDHVTRIFLHGIDYAYSQSLTYLEGQLDPRRFIRLHRNNIVAIDAIASVRRGPNMTVVLKTGVELPVSRERKQKLRRILDSLS